VSQPSPADALFPDASPAQGAAGAALTPPKRRVVWQLIVLVAIPVVLGLTLAGLSVSGAARTAAAYGQAARLAAVGRQVNGLAQAMEDERSATAVFIADGRPAAGVQALHRQYVITDGRAASVRRLVRGLGGGYPAQTRASAAAVLASIADLPGLRKRAAQSQASGLAVLNGYSAAASGLFPVTDGIAGLSSNVALASSVQTLGTLSRMIDQAGQQQAILRLALAEGRFGPGTLTALLTAQARQASELGSFRNSATPEESWALTKTLAGPLPQRAEAVEQRAIAASGGALAFGPQASQQSWDGMSYTVGWMRYAQQQQMNWITADAQALQRSAMRSAMVTGGAALAALALVLLGTFLVARSMLRRLRGLETAAALDVAAASEEARRYAGASAISASFFRRSHALLERLLRLIDSVELSEDDPERLASLFQMDHLATRVWRNSDSALVLTGHQTPRHPAEPLPLVDVLRGAVSEIEQYDRVILSVQEGISVRGSAATDIVHLLAELLENATGFSPEATEVIVSGYATRGGGSLIKIIDGGAGMLAEQLTQLNWRLAHPSVADAAAARPVGLFTVAHLAARHGITVTLSKAPDGGTIAEVLLPATLISRDARPGRPRQAGGALRAGTGGRAGTRAAAELPFSAPRFASGPLPTAEPETAAPEAVPQLAAAPVPPAPAQISPGVSAPGPADAEPDGKLPIFESVESRYPRAPEPEPARPGDPQAGQPAPAEQPAAVPETPPAGDGPARLPRRVPQAGRDRSAEGDQQAAPDTPAESAEIMRSRLASFQQGSRRARAVARMNSTKQPDQDG
jgi:signal transduction histidine kinase